jgi:hypothetical protein
MAPDGQIEGLPHGITLPLTAKIIDGCRFDVMLRRYGNEVSVNLLDRQGNGRVAVSL